MSRDKSLAQEDLRVGDKVTLGHYPQGNNGDPAPRALSDRECILMEPTRLFYMNFFENGKCSFDFEKAEDSHYTLEAPEKEKLTAYLQRKMNSNESALDVLVRAYLGSLLEQPQKLENAVVRLLYASGISYKQYHFY